ncbi:MAG: methyltransferase domain-containing protein [Chlorobiaceae bacterium]
MNSVGKRNQESRDEWLEKTIKLIPSGSRVLDAGAGELKYKKYCTHLEYVAQDFAEYDGRGDESGLQMGTWDQSKLDLVSDITSIPQPDASFDAILCIEVFEHLPDPLAAIKEFTRLLKPGGHLIITSPFSSIAHFAPYYYYTGFSKYFYLTHLENSGYNIAEIAVNGNYFEYLAQELRRVKSIGKKFANIRASFIEHLAIQLLLLMLGRLSRHDTGSSELLHFGCQVHATKQL